jgi:hypothetical protein
MIKTAMSGPKTLFVSIHGLQHARAEPFQGY